MSAYRIAYEVKDGAVKITSVTPVQTRVPPSPPARVLDTGTGSWVEVRDEAGSRIWGRVLDESLLAGEARLQVGDGIGTMTRVPLKTLTDFVLVPAAEGGSVHFLHRSGAGERPRTLASRKF
ncbi:MAG: hypothetical protein ACFCUS_01850 [Rubrimonas sp.]